MASPAVSSSGFVAVVDTTKQDGVWNKPGGVNFLIFMVIGFCSTLTAIILGVAVYIIARKICRRQRAQALREAELTVTVPEPKELFVVIHPGGSADIASKDDNEPRKLVLKNKPIKFNSAVISIDAIPAYRDNVSGASTEHCHIDQKNDQIGVYCAEQISPQHRRIELQAFSSYARPLVGECIGLDDEHLDNAPIFTRVRSSQSRLAADSGSGTAAINETRDGSREEMAYNWQQRIPHLSVSSQGQHLNTDRSYASDEYVEDIRLLTQRFSKS